MYFHEVAGELKDFLAPTERAGVFVVQLVGDVLRQPMTDEEEKMALNDKFNPLASGMSLTCKTKFMKVKNSFLRLEQG